MATLPDLLPNSYQFTYKMHGTQKLVSPEEQDVMGSLYQKGYTTYQIGRALNRTDVSVSQRLKRAGIKARDMYHAGKKLTINEDYFEQIDTPTKAYLLGMIYADGNVYKNRFYISLWDVDREFLEATSREIGFNGKLYVESQKRRGPNRHDMLKMSVYSNRFVSHLHSKGVIPNKTNKLTFPSWLRKDLQIHFIHGIMDGDGCITKTSPKQRKNETIHTTGFSGCYVVMKGVYDYFYAKGIIGHLRHNNRNPLSGTIFYSGTKALQVTNLIYQEKQYLFLVRKWTKYKEMVHQLNSGFERKKPYTQEAIKKGLVIIEESNQS